MSVPMKRALLLSGAMLIVVMMLIANGCSKSVTPADPSALKYAYYTEDYIAAQTRSPQGLSDYMTALHTDYHQFGWNICASLVRENQDTTAFFIAVEWSATSNEYRGGIGIGNSEKDGYHWSGFTNSSVEITSNPWSITLYSAQIPWMWVKIELTSGLMGAPNAVYTLTGDVLTAELKNLKLNVRLRDAYGAINQGYGTTSFYPHYITPKQRERILAMPDRTIDAYLTASGDPMAFQGAIYYAQPLMDVEQFTIENDGATISGTRGKSWMDYFVKSYNEESMRMQSSSAWNWIAVQLPEINAAINVLKISNSGGGILPFARLFSTGGTLSKNGAHNALQSWGIDEVTVEPFGDRWTTPTGVTYSMGYHIFLASKTMPGVLTVTMLRHNQAVVLPEGSNYQGLGRVEGTLGGRTVSGLCWVEVQPL